MSDQDTKQPQDEATAPVTNNVILDGVTEYGDGMDVRITKNDEECGYEPDEEGYGRLSIVAFNESGHNATYVDLVQLLSWVKRNEPDLWSSI